MKLLSRALILCASCILLAGGNLWAETKVELKGVHLCCGGCVTAVKDAVADISGATVVCDRPGKTISISAADEATVQKAIDAIAAAGYHGESSSKDLKCKDDSGAKAGKVARIELTGVHNCCGGCNKAIKAALKTVDGVEADTAKPDEESFVVEGNFDALNLIKALNAAGFHVKVAKK